MLLFLGVLLELLHLELGATWLLILVHLVLEVVLIDLFRIPSAELDDVIVTDMRDGWLERLALPCAFRSDWVHPL